MRKRSHHLPLPSVPTSLLLLGVLVSFAGMSPAHAIVVTCTQDADALAGALAGPGITVTDAALSGHGACGQTPSATSGTYTNASGTYGIGPGVVLSSGQATDYGDGPNTETGRTTAYGVPATAAQEALLDPITGGGLNHFDVTQLTLTFDVDAGTNTVFFNVTFGSEEFDEFVGSSFIDAFGIYLNGVNIALFNGLPVNINHPDMAFIGGTELDGLLDPTGGTGNPIMLFTGAVDPGSTDNILTFIIADSGDSALDSTVYISGFGNVDPGGGTPGGGIDGTPPGTVPEPGTLGLLAVAFAGLAAAGRRRARN